VSSDLVDGADIWVVERRSRPGLSAKTFECLGVLGKIIGQKLQGDESPKPGVLGLVDDTHPAAAQLLDDVVVRDDLADHGWRRNTAAMLGTLMGQVNRVPG